MMAPLRYQAAEEAARQRLAALARLEESRNAAALGVSSAARVLLVWRERGERIPEVVWTQLEEAQARLQKTQDALDEVACTILDEEEPCPVKL